MNDMTLLQAMGVIDDTPATPTRPPDDHYRTPPACMRALAAVEGFTGGVHEFCAGDGTLAAAAADVLGDHQVYASTLYASPKTYFPVQTGADFLTLDRLRRPALVSNPPYSYLGGKRMRNAGAATAIIRHALALLDASGDPNAKLCCLLDLRYRLSGARNKPGGLLHEYPPDTIHAFQDRVTMYPPMTEAVEVNPGTMAFGWFIWRPPFRRPGAGTWMRCELAAADFVRPDDRKRFDLPKVKSIKRKRGGDE
jgi:hypothetical protein